jgi:hypothetical protein
MIFCLFAGLFPGIYRIRGKRKNMACKTKNKPGRSLKTRLDLGRVVA